MRIVNAFLIFIFTTLIANFTSAGTIVYDVFESDENRHIWAMNEDGTNKTQLTFGNVKDWGPAVSPNGELIAFASEREDLGIYLYDVGEKTVRKIYSHTVPYGPLGAGGLFFSNDSNKVYFYYGYRSGRGEYYYVTIDGSTVGPLTNFGLNTRAVDISPDGTKLVYSQQSGSNAGAQEIYTSDLDGTSVLRLTNNSKNDSGPKWSNDGTQILWRKRQTVGRPPLNLYLMNADGSDQQALTSYPNSLVTGFDFSPDGTQIAYTVDINGVRDIFLVNIDGSNPINITNDGHFVSALDWTPHSLLNEAPVADAGENLTIASEEQHLTMIHGIGTDADNDELTYRWMEGLDVLSDWKNVGAGGEAILDLSDIDYFSIGDHELLLEVDDGQVSHSDTMILTVGNSAPHAAPTGAGVYEIWSDVTLGGQVSDFDGDFLTYEWLEGNTLLFSGNISSIKEGDPVSLPEYFINSLDLGVYTLSLNVSDGINDVVTGYIDVEIVDTTMPTLAPNPNKTILWPPNHKMVDIIIEANANDNSSMLSLSVAIESNEPQEEMPDWTDPVIDQETGLISFQLRSERSGSGDGRTYSVIITATDSSGNSSEALIEIIVPHDQGKKKK